MLCTKGKHLALILLGFKKLPGNQSLEDVGSPTSEHFYTEGDISWLS